MKSQSEFPPLRRAVSLPALTFYSAGTILGVGIYVLVEEVAAEAEYGILGSLEVVGLLVGMTANSFETFSVQCRGSVMISKMLSLDSLK